jgi:riboflavin synthase
MFTGIVTDIGEVLSVEDRAEGLRRLVIACRYDSASIGIGASIACSGVCMTAVETGKRSGRYIFSVDHLVSGHVDGIAELIRREDLTDMARLTFRVPKPLARFIAQKGSVALDGVSLTVNEVSEDTFSVLIIPHTLTVTTFGALKQGDRINLEIDVMARYAARLMETR